MKILSTWVWKAVIFLGGKVMDGLYKASQDIVFILFAPYITAKLHYITYIDRVGNTVYY